MADGPRLVVAAIGIALVVTACGDDERVVAASTTATSAAAAPPTEEVTTSSSTATTTTTSTPTTTTTTTTTTTEASGPTVAVDVFFTIDIDADCGSVEAFPRTAPAGVDPMLAAFDELARGPTASEAAAGAGSFFSSVTADVVTSVRLTDELMLVDFEDLRPLMPSASSSCGREALLAQLNATAFQFQDVERVRYRVDGSCDEFANWLQGDCFDADRSGARGEVPTEERASWAGCTPSSDGDLPDGRWFGFVVEVEADQLGFDLACWFAGTAAAVAAEEDGQESPPPNDFYIRNHSEAVRLLPVEATAEVAWLPNPGDPVSVEVVTYSAWVALRSTRLVMPPVWLQLADNRVSSVEEQYVP